MKQWIQKLTGLVLGTFLAVSLSGKATANTPEDTDADLPEAPAVEIVEEADNTTLEDIPVLDASSADDDTETEDEEDIEEIDPTLPSDAGAVTVTDPVDGTDLSGTVIVNTVTVDDDDTPTGSSTEPGSPEDGLSPSVDGGQIPDAGDAEAKATPPASDPAPAAAPAIDTAQVQRLSSPPVLLGSPGGSEAENTITLQDETVTDPISLTEDTHIIASGFNIIKEITTSATLYFKGTGILLLDKIAGNIALEADDGAKGTVAVFQKDEHGMYNMINNGLPGSITDGLITEGIVIPDGIQLNVTPNNQLILASSDESSASLTIEDNAGLSVDGSLKMTGFYEGDTDNKAVLTVEDGGSLEINGTLEMANASVRFDTATINNVKVTDRSDIAFHGPSEINNIDIASSTLTLQTTNYYIDYSDANALSITGGITGGGVLCLDSGIYEIANSATHSGASVTFGYPLVYDYSDDILTTDTSPLQMQPGAEEARTVSETGAASIPVVATAIKEETARGETQEDAANQPKTLSVESEYSFTVPAYAWKTEGGNKMIDLAEIKAIADSLREENDIQQYAVIVEILHKDSAGMLSTDFFVNYSTTTVDEITGEEHTSETDELTGKTVPADDVYLIRINFVYSKGAPWGGGTVSNTSTSFTGSGVLGGAGAGAVRLANLRVVITEKADRYLLQVFSGDREITDLNGRSAIARMDFSMPADWNSGAIFAVFKNSDGTLSAVKAVYDPVAGTLRFETKLTGEFILVCFDYKGVLYSDAFYAALSQLPEVQRFLKA